MECLQRVDSPEDEARIAERIRNASSFRERFMKVVCVEKALKAPQSAGNIVVRALDAAFPGRRVPEWISLICRALRITISFAEAPTLHETAHEAVRVAVCRAAGLETSEVSLPIIMKALIDRHGAVILVIDEILDLHKWVRSKTSDVDHVKQMYTELKMVLLAMCYIPGCILYVAGRSVWRHVVAASTASTLHDLLVVLDALDSVDVGNMLRAEDPRHRLPVYETMHVDPADISEVAEALTDISGGVGRQLLLLVKEAQATPRGSGQSIRKWIETMSESLRPTETVNAYPHAQDIQLMFNIPAPDDKAVKSYRAKLLREVMWPLILEEPIEKDSQATIGSHSCPILQLATAFGITFVTASPTTVRLRAPQSIKLLLIAIAEHSIGFRLDSDSLIRNIEAYGGTVKGRMMELLCVDSFLLRCVQGGRDVLRLDQALPMFGGLSCASWTVGVDIGRTLLPKVTERAASAAARDATTISPADLADHLRTACAGRPRLVMPEDGTSGSLDWFVLTADGIVGISQKALFDGSSGYSVDQLRADLAKLDQVGTSEKRVLLVLSTKLSSAISSAIRGEILELQTGVYDATLHRRPRAASGRTDDVVVEKDVAVIIPQPESWMASLLTRQEAIRLRAALERYHGTAVIDLMRSPLDETPASAAAAAASSEVTSKPARTTRGRA